MIMHVFYQVSHSMRFVIRIPSCIASACFIWLAACSQFTHARGFVERDELASEMIVVLKRSLIIALLFALFNFFAPSGFAESEQD